MQMMRAEPDPWSVTPLTRPETFVDPSRDRKVSRVVSLGSLRSGSLEVLALS
jgi:hypothetical protein